MEGLPAPDTFHLHAAEGWLDLGNAREAQSELDQITPELRGHPDVWLLRWQVHARAGRWYDCLGIALGLTEGLPDDPRGWIALGQTLRRQQRLQDAFDIAVSKIPSFPTYAPLYYDAACYACLVGQANRAREFLELAMLFGDPTDIRARLRTDPDLAALKIRK